MGFGSVIMLSVRSLVSLDCWIQNMLKFVISNKKKCLPLNCASEFATIKEVPSVFKNALAFGLPAPIFFSILTKFDNLYDHWKKILLPVSCRDAE